MRVEISFDDVEQRELVIVETKDIPSFVDLLKEFGYMGPNGNTYDLEGAGVLPSLEPTFRISTKRRTEAKT